MSQHRRRRRRDPLTWAGALAGLVTVVGMVFAVHQVWTSPPPHRAPVVVPYRLPYAGPSAPTAAVPTPDPVPRR